MGVIGRLRFLGVLVGLLVALVPAEASVAAGAPCQDDGFTERLECWAGRISEGPLVITLKGPLEYEEIGERHREVIKRLREDAHPVVVQVSKGARTGQGGTALLLIAEGLLIHPSAEVERLHARTMADLKESDLCDDTNQLCAKVGPGQGSATLKGAELAAFAADPDDNSFTVPDSDGNPGSSASSGASGGQGDKNRGEQGQEGKGRGVGNQPDIADGRASENSGSTWAALWMGLLLALLLLAFVIVIRRSRGPVAVGHRAASPGRAVGGPARAAPAHAARGGGGSGGGGRGDGGDESTTRLRVAPAPRRGRQVGARPAHARTAVVRTELHPQGYVEVDRVLRRAVWAEPGRPPPAPGGLVDVADARERDSDVLYAFPPTAARHAKGTPR
ncbi:hypothetical protein ACWD26_40480 [Streptomyces sp. NPDC002787]